MGLNFGHDFFLFDSYVILFVFQPVDYDSLLNPFFNLTVHVHDSDTTHIDTAYIEVFVTDYNDNAPRFEPKPIHQVKVYENITAATTLAKFRATDRDTGINQKFRCVGKQLKVGES